MKNTNFKFTYIFIFLILGIVNNVTAQTDKRFEKIKAHKIAYITDKLELTSEEAEKFWPIYNHYEKTLHQLLVLDRHTMIEEVRNKGGIDQLSDARAKKITLQVNNNRSKVFNTEKEKFEKLEALLSAKKILKLHLAEKSFKKELFKRLQKQRKKKF